MDLPVSEGMKVMGCRPYINITMVTDTGSLVVDKRYRLLGA